MNRKTKIVVSVAGILIVTLFLIGLTYAYFLTRINGNTNPKSISASTQKLELTYNDNSSEIIGDGKELMPSNEPIGSKTFTVTNNGGDTNYSVVLEDMSIKDATTNEETTFESNDFRYKLTCTTKSGSSCNEINEQTELPLISVALLNNDIAKGDIHTYTLTIWYLETGVDQSNDMGKTISAKINIIDPVRENPYRNNKNSLAYNIINNAILQKNGTNLVNTPETVPGAEVTPWEYGKQDDPISFTFKNNNATNLYVSYASDYIVDKKTGKFTLGTETSKVTTVKYSELQDKSVLKGKYAFWNTDETSASNVSNLNVLFKVSTVLEDITSETISYAVIRSTDRYAKKGTEKELSISPDDYGNSYYYRGGVTDNYLELNNMCFRIVRIEGDGSIKLTLAQEDSCSTQFQVVENSSLINKVEAVIYGYKTVNSKILFDYEGYKGGLYTKLNEWYNTNLSSVQSKLKNEIWCLGGKTKYNGAGNLLDVNTTETWYYYETGLRLWGDENSEGIKASYRCPSDADKVTGYIGALTADDVAFAGGSSVASEVNYAYYLQDEVLNSSFGYWTISSSYFESTSDYAFYVVYDGALSSDTVNGSFAVRPAITLKSGVELLSGDGTKNNPYTIK